MSVFEGLASLHVNNGVCTVMASGKNAHGKAVIGWVPRCALALCNVVSNAVIVHRG